MVYREIHVIIKEIDEVESSKRDYLFDNMKGILILFVVFGHILEMMLNKSDGIIREVYTAIYLIHMPMFVFISGYFSKKHSEEGVIKLFLIYSLWQMVIFPLLVALGTNSTYLEELNPLFQPEYTYWYLLSLVIWKVCTPYVEKIKHFFIISIVFGLLIGFTELQMNLNLFSFARTVACFPFFFAGYLLSEEKFYKIESRFTRVKGILLSIAFIAFGLSIIYAFSGDLVKPTSFSKILAFKYKYDALYKNEFIGLFLRLVLYMIQFVLIFTVFAIVPKVKTIFATWGRSSLLIYLTHAILLTVLNKHILMFAKGINEYQYIIFAIATSCILCMLLSLKPVVGKLKKFG